jgi:uncharacterized membrane protein HdeD (DUF308 family)
MNRIGKKTLLRVGDHRNAILLPQGGEIMSSAPYPSVADLLNAEREHLSKSWFWLMLMGVLLIIVGLMAISASFIATLATVLVFGVLFLIGGCMEIASSLWARRWRGFWLHLLAGIVYVVLGFFLIQQPLDAAVAFTLVIAVTFFIGGLFRIVLAVVERFHGWGWVFVNGLVTLALGIMIWRRWPEASFWVIGLFVGIDLLFNGWSWVFAALAVRSLAKRPL